MPPARCFGAALALALLAGCKDSTAPPEEETTFAAPIVGTPMTDVFYGAHLDHDPGTGARDWACGIKAYDGHNGVDILLRNFRVQDEGVQVIAAADGTVIRTVNGFPDRNTTWDLGGGLANHVEISHPGGLVSYYGHMRLGSIEVAEGQSVRRGDVLGLVGSSGTSNWPHLHFEVRRDGAPVDPFAGECSSAESLWTNQLPYQNAFMVMDAGITDQPGTLAALLERPPTLGAIPLDAPSFRFWIQLANQQTATMRYEVRTPGGALHETVQQQVGATFSIRYLVLNVPVAGELTQAGTWEIRTYQNGQLIRTQPFTLIPAAEVSGAAVRAPSSLEVQVIDQAPPGAHEHP
jgi:murein DD-endopeptidase MepM/ murein hydrolase activator NlpD